MNASAEHSVASGRPHDRRECPRVPFSFLCRCALESEPYEESRGDLSTGGVFWGTTHAAHCKEVEVRIAIPGEREEIHARGEIVGHRAAGFHVRFTALATDDELRIARYIDEVGIGWEQVMDWSALESAARAVLPNAHAPYSGFPVAAAVRFADGGIETGVNVENASYPLSVCAERNAVASGVRSGRGRIQAVLILTDARTPTPPCGGCRQVLAEFGGPEVVVRSLTLQGRSAEHTLGALLPEAFASPAPG